MKEFKNLKRVACEELAELDKKYENAHEFTEADAKKYEILTHAWKSHLTAEAMENAYEDGPEYEESFARGRHMGGRRMSRDMEPNYSGHYPPTWMYPPRSYRMYPDNVNY